MLKIAHSMNRRTFGASLLAATTPLPNIAVASQKAMSARVFVSLADNDYQGIVPIPSALGKGDNARNNLYWGALYGIKTYFSKNPHWTVTPARHSSPRVLDAIWITPKSHPDIRIFAEAWHGAYQKETLEYYQKALTRIDDDNSLVAFVGHNPLMDLTAPDLEITQDIIQANKSRHRKSAVLACKSASYFTDFIRKAGVEDYVMTHGLMAPEAYALEGILSAWINGDDAIKARQNAASKYSQYQNIPLSNSQKLFGVNPDHNERRSK
ncbi:MAG: hypothetical protein ACPGVT_05225 [Maricaulaceae bacterium]